MHDQSALQRTPYGNSEKAPSLFIKRFVKPFVVNSLLVLLSCVVTLAGIEASLRIYSMFLPPAAPIPYPGVIWLSSAFEDVARRRATTAIQIVVGTSAYFVVRAASRTAPRPF